MRARSEEQWRELFAQHDTSGVSAAEFCKQHDLCPKYFSLRWFWGFPFASKLLNST